MTIPNWGRITPAQGFMLRLAGHVLQRYVVPPGTVEPDEERLRSMKAGKKSLCSLTGEDFGYDLARWHEWLLANDDVGYKHPYAWRTVRPAIERAIADPDRIRLAGLLEAE
jgi:hypothetical protein